MMKAYQYAAYGGPEVMKLVDTAIPSVPANAVRIKVHALSFNPIDFKRRSGALKAVAPDTFPVILGYDAAGVVDSVGTGVTKFKVGDPVYTRIGKNFPCQGTAAEFTLAAEDMVAPKPTNMSFEEAAAVPLAALTALQMLRRAGFKSGDKVFITAGAGGVGHYAIQLAKLMGASFIASTASAAKHPLVKSLGADEVIDYKTAKYTDAYADRRFDVALDMTNEVVDICKITKKGGTIVSVVGGLNTDTFLHAQLPAPGFIVKAFLWFTYRGQYSAASSAGVTLFGLLLRPNADDLEELTKYIESGKVKSIIKDNVFNGMDSCPEAMKLVESGRATGKVVVKLV
jgi:alcohol dehydrogenase